VKIRSIELTNFRKFVGTVRVENIGDNVNVLVGRNELGKSTLLEAINAVIFEKAKSTAAHVKAYRHFVNGTVPEVKLSFDIDGRSWTIHKRFAGQPGKAILTCSDKRVFEDDAAEAELQRLLGFVGGNRGGEPGIWGTLWVQQGQSFGDFSLDDQAQRTMQGCIESQIGIVTGGKRGKSIPKAIRESLETLQSTKGPRGKFKDAVERLELTRGKIEELQARRQLVARQVEELAEKKYELNRARSDWDEAERQFELSSTRDKRTAAAIQAEEINTATAAANLARERADQARKTNDERVSLIADLKPLEEKLAAFDDQSATAEAASNVAKKALDDVDAELSKLRRGVSENAETGRALERARGIAQIANEIVVHEATVTKAESLENEAKELSEKIGAISANSSAVTRIEEAQAKLSAAIAAKNAVAATISFDLNVPGFQDVLVDGHVLDMPKKAISILSKTTVTVRNLGKLIVEPQIKNHTSLVEQQDAAEVELEEALRDAGVADLFAARIAAAQRRELVDRSINITKELADLAPGNSSKKLQPGIDRLKSYLGQLRGRLRAATDSAGIAKAPNESDLTAEIVANHDAAVSLAQQVEAAEAKLAGRKEVFDDAERHLHDLREQRAKLGGEVDSKNATLKAGREVAADSDIAEHSENLEKEATSKLDDLEMKRAQQGETTEAIDARIQRLENAITNQQRSVSHLGNEVTRLTTLVEASEGVGVEEQLLIAEADKFRIEAAVGEYRNEAAVLSLLLETLETAESEAKTRYLAPIVDHVEPYLKMLIPGANIILDEALGISAIQRGGQEEDFLALSGGTREQLAILTRIAFAELLQAQGRPATIILDDALAFSDDERIESMFDVLMRAGQNIQIIVLTCRRKLFNRLGASPIEIVSIA